MHDAAVLKGTKDGYEIILDEMPIVKTFCLRLESFWIV